MRKINGLRGRTGFCCTLENIRALLPIGDPSKPDIGRVATVQVSAPARGRKRQASERFPGN
jgi:hypothetical protein